MVEHEIWCSLCIYFLLVYYYSPLRKTGFSVADVQAVAELLKLCPRAKMIK